MKQTIEWINGKVILLFLISTIYDDRTDLIYSLRKSAENRRGELLIKFLEFINDLKMDLDFSRSFLFYLHRHQLTGCWKKTNCSLMKREKKKWIREKRQTERKRREEKWKPIDLHKQRWQNKIACRYEEETFQKTRANTTMTNTCIWKYFRKKKK